MNLRPYQIRTLDYTWDALQGKMNVLITAPCSAGKTILFSKIIQRLLRENPSFRALILVDREILVTQSADKLRRVAPELALSVGIICSSVTPTKHVHLPVTVASRQSLINHLDRFPPVQLVICDEAHLLGIPHDDDPVPDQYAQIISKLKDYNPRMRLLGCTASPYRLGPKGGYIYGHRNRSDARPYFESVDAKITTRELLDGGYIAPLTGMVRADDTITADLSSVSVIGGEYNLGQLSNVMCRAHHVQSCIDAWKQYASERKKTLVFCTTIEHAEAVSAAFNDAGIGAMAIHSKLPAMVEMDRMDALKTGRSKVFTSVAKLTTGMDVVDIDCIIMARPTKSTALWQQCVGRGQRLAPGKTDCLVIDLVGATWTFGSDMDNLIVQVPLEARSGEAPTKICPGVDGDGISCGKSVHASLKYCPHCNYEFPVTEAVEASVGTLHKVEFNQIQEPDRYTVTDVTYQTHQSKSTEKWLIRVTYECGVYSRFSEYLCFPDFYSGYAVEKATAWWEERSDEPFPASVDEFMFLSETLSEPTAILVVKEGRFDKITGYEFGEKEENEEFYDMADLGPTSDEVPF